MGSPSGRVPERAPKRFLVATEACDGGNPDLLCSWMFSGYIGIYRMKKYVGGRPRGPRDRGRALQGGAPSYLVGALAASLLALQVIWITFVPKITLPKVSFRLDSV